MNLQKNVAEVVPLKQGLKLTYPLPIYRSYHITVAEVVPLKQGLKRNNGWTFAGDGKSVAEVVPLKQGLKHTRQK